MALPGGAIECPGLKPEPVCLYANRAEPLRAAYDEERSGSRRSERSEFGHRIAGERDLHNQIRAFDSFDPEYVIRRD